MEGEPAPYLAAHLCRDQRFQSYTAWDDEGASVLLDQALLLESREQPADGFTRCANHLPDLLVCQGQFHLAGILGIAVLIEPSHHQASEFFAGRVGEDEVADFPAGRSVILAD